ncbi:hypothetical protein SRABI04_02559 [Chryseobacterium sp. Bi04]|nr:hypothetical protein SRABI04_02559 [Chryseobacterium sp. Bi04]
MNLTGFFIGTYSKLKEYLIHLKDYKQPTIMKGHLKSDSEQID